MGRHLPGPMGPGMVPEKVLSVSLGYLDQHLAEAAIPQQGVDLDGCGSNP